jgi:hypothetical protein
MYSNFQQIKLRHSEPFLNTPPFVTAYLTIGRVQSESAV